MLLTALILAGRPAEAVQYNGYNYRDPFQSEQQMVTGEAGKKINLKSLSLEGFVWNSDKPQAIINGKIVKRGSKIGNAEVVDIQKEGVKLRYQGQEFYLKRRSIVNK